LINNFLIIIDCIKVSFRIYIITIKMDHVVAVRRSDGSQQIAKICPAYGRDEEGVIKVTWFSDGAEIGKYIPFNELYIVDLKTRNNNSQNHSYSDIKSKLINLLIIIAVVVITVYCMDVFVKWFRKNEV
jgi:hypothetical protein